MKQAMALGEDQDYINHLHAGRDQEIEAIRQVVFGADCSADLGDRLPDWPLRSARIRRPGGDLFALMMQNDFICEREHRGRSTRVRRTCRSCASASMAKLGTPSCRIPSASAAPTRPWCSQVPTSDRTTTPVRVISTAFSGGHRLARRKPSSFCNEIG